MNIIQLYICNANNAINYKTKVKEYFPTRYNNSLSYKNENDRLLSVAASFLIIHSTGITDENELLYTEYGKPLSRSGIRFNLSHSSEYAVCAVSDYEIGVDIEKISEPREKVAEKVFTEEEIQWYLQDTSKRFFQLWTAKESFIKCTGLGFGHRLSEINTLPCLYSSPVVFENKDYYIKSFIYNGYAVSICSQRPIDSIQISFIK